MPIHPDQADLYPPNWFEIAQLVKVKANWTCVTCGAVHGFPHPVNGKLTVVTVAHLDHNPANCADENLRCLCSVCHLRYDAKQHALASLTRKARALRAAGQVTLPVPGGLFK